MKDTLNATAISTARADLRTIEGDMLAILRETGNQAANCIMDFLADVYRIEHVILFGGSLWV